MVVRLLSAGGRGSSVSDSVRGPVQTGATGVAATGPCLNARFRAATGAFRGHFDWSVGGG